ncbi:flavin reductase [Candidatus Dependentiae bacterium]|nr:flavin reductase [Candidatus Dependentiae bacterium]
MERIEIPFNEFSTNTFNLWKNQWLLLTSGEFEAKNFNMMTVAWGGFGIMWDKPIAIIVVRPSRYTFEFIEKFNTFTLSSFSENFRNKLTVCGTKTGRTTDKIKETGLTPVKSKKICAPSYKESELSIECKKIYFDDFKPMRFISSEIENVYNGSDYHRMYFGEIVFVEGIEKYRTVK